jgi:hypothetical protein
MSDNKKSADKFKLDLAKIFDSVVPGKVIAMHQEIAVDGLRRLIAKSPVGNPSIWQSNLDSSGNRRSKRSKKIRKPEGYVGGQFRGNWQMSIGSFDTAEVAGIRSPSATMSAGESVAKRLTDFGVSHLQNNLPYAQRLEEGHSGQAPMGMIALTFGEMNIFAGQLASLYSSEQIKDGGS